MGLVDAHCHFDFPEFDGQRAAIMDQLASAGIDRIVIPGVREQDWDRVKRVSSAHRGIHYCLGLHPWFIDDHEESALESLRQQLQARPEGCVALGECGLDRIHGDLDRQQWWFEAQVEMARDLGWPLVVHSVKTHDEVLATLKQYEFDSPVLLHGFSGSEQQAQKLADFGAFIGVGGVITHDRARKTRRAIASLPLSALVLETDAPDMPPAGVEKGANSPVRLKQILGSLLELRKESEEEVVSALEDNVSRLYRWERKD
ncbi:TatD family hydrolase [Marinobacter sp.]|uniref:TatD family hydrolase n=1 Tax=Marinobacter sp. TaxID=50741 RepID=UPI00384F735F